VLLELDAHLPRRQQLRLERPDVAVTGQSQLLHQPSHRRLAPGQLRRGPDRMEGRILPALLRGQAAALVLGADVLGVQVFRAGVQAAQVALAAVGRALDVPLANQRELQAAHRPVRLDGVAQQVARAQLGAEAALVARAASDALDLPPVLPPPPHDDVPGRQHDHAAGGLVHQRLVVVLQNAHHHAADHVVGFAGGRPAGRGHALGQRDAYRHAERDRLSDGAGDGEVLLGHRARRRAGDVQRRLDVHHHGCDVQRQPAGRHDAPQHVVDQHELISGGIGVLQRSDVHPARQLGPQDVDDVTVLLLDADHAARGAHKLHRGRQPGQHVLGVSAKHLLVLVQQRLALGRVEQHRVRLGGELDVRGKARPACPHHARGADGVYGYTGHARSLRADASVRLLNRVYRIRPTQTSRQEEAPPVRAGNSGVMLRTPSPC
jgi:hypothetical protein